MLGAIALIATLWLLGGSVWRAETPETAPRDDTPSANTPQDVSANKSRDRSALPPIDPGKGSNAAKPRVDPNATAQSPAQAAKDSYENRLFASITTLCRAAAGRKPTQDEMSSYLNNKLANTLKLRSVNPERAVLSAVELEVLRSLMVNDFPPLVDSRHHMEMQKVEAFGNAVKARQLKRYPLMTQITQEILEGIVTSHAIKPGDFVHAQCGQPREGCIAIVFLLRTTNFEFFDARNRHTALQGKWNEKVAAYVTKALAERRTK